MTNESHHCEDFGEQHVDAEKSRARPDPRTDIHFRSELMRRLKSRPVTTELQPSSGVVPRVIVQYWDDLDHVPPDVAKCMKSWAVLDAQGFQIELFDDRTARDYIAIHYDSSYVRAFDACPHPAMRSDYFRLCYIVKNGGIYVDADDMYTGADIRPFLRDSQLRVQALCYDIPNDTMIDLRSAPQVDEHHGERIYYVNNNPLLAPPGHPVLINALRSSTTAILEHNGGPVDVQSTTGPGNLTLALAVYALAREAANQTLDVEIITNWDDFGLTQWPLDYRYDERNWRLWRHGA